MEKPIHETPFSINVDRRGDTAIVNLVGSCTMTVSKKLGDSLRDLGGQGLRSIIIDLSSVDFIESSGLGGIVAGYLRAKIHKSEFRLVNPSPDIRKLLEITRLEQLFGIYDSIDAAIKH